MSNPKNLEECYEALNSLLSKEDIEDLKSMPEKKAAAEAHHGIGRWLRNNWGLWGSSDIKDYFKSLGIWHADDMSGIIIDSYHRHLNGKDIDLEGQVKYYKDYWKKMKVGSNDM